MAAMLTNVIGKLVDGKHLSGEEMRLALTHIMTGEAHPAELAAFLTALRMKGETPDELAAAVGVLREHMIRLPTDGLQVLDTCGTGGDESGTFNISTAAALVAASCGVKVAKHGNRAVSSASGSADVLTALGVRIDLEPEAVRRCLHEIGFAFCFAPKFHPAMRHVADVRKRLRFRTLFNLLGPLCNPAGAGRHLLGVGKLALLDLLAQTLARLGVENALLVHADDGLDEVSLAGPTQVRQVCQGKITASVWRPEDFGLRPCKLDELRVANAEQSANRIQAVLRCESGPSTDMVVANAAAALLAARGVDSIREGVAAASNAIKKGSAFQLLERLRALTSDK
jgi:anthranilate phosphoribosyltransferase